MTCLMLQAGRLFPEAVSVSFAFLTGAVLDLQSSLRSPGGLRAGWRQDVTSGTGSLLGTAARALQLGKRVFEYQMMLVLGKHREPNIQEI